MLEDCQSIVVYSNDEDDSSPATQVNDFNWLRTDQPSPNYTLVRASSSSSSETPSDRQESNRQIPVAAAFVTKPAAAAWEIQAVADPISRPQDSNDGGDADTDDDEL